MRLILASGSPRRKEFLSEIINNDKLVVAYDNVEEVYTSVEPNEIVKEIAILKGIKKSHEFPKDFVVSSDTIVECEGEILGKPVDTEDAKRVLYKLSGKIHSVYSSVAVFYKGKIETIVEKTDVEFYQLEEEQIDIYIKSGDPMDKAGSYGIQGFAKLFIKKIDGNYSNIVGFPISRFYNKYKNIIKEINNEK